MHRDVHDVLASYPVATTVHRELHDVPPHRVHEITFDGQRAVCKVATGPTASPAMEGQVLELAADHSTVPVPEVLAVGADHFVVTWCDGLQSDPSLDDVRARTMGRGLARFHESMADAFDRPGLLRDHPNLIHDADERWSDTLVSFVSECRDYLANVGYSAIADDVIATLESHRSALDAVSGVTLLHGNFLPAHVGIARDGEGGARMTCVIDFEHALVGAPGFDYVRTVLPTFGPRDDGAALERDFRDGYEAVRRLPAGFECRRPLYEATNAVSYLRSLHVQRGGRDAPQAIARDALELQELASARLEEFGRQAERG